MTPEERQLIADLFERMRSFGRPEKDREAEALINQSVRALPDATYMLVQSVLVQEQALEAANNHVLELEGRLRDLEGGDQPRSSKSGGFLGGFWGRRDEEPKTGSVPQVGSRATPSAYESRSPWSQSAPPQPPPPQQPAPVAASGGFMRSALTTAAGVAGGMLVADGLRNMLGGAHANPSSATGLGSGRKEEPQDANERDNDPGNDQDTDNDPGYDSNDSGGDGEIEI
jgi:hypothetical protein